MKINVMKKHFFYSRELCKNFEHFICTLLDVRPTTRLYNMKLDRVGKYLNNKLKMLELMFVLH